MQAFREHNVFKRARLVSRTLDSRLMERERYHYATRAGFTLEVYNYIFKVSRTLLNMPQIVICPGYWV